jgi:Transmembrane domain of unknown function (DUF3566)
VTEGYQPPTSRSGDVDQDTATLPRVTVPPASGGSAPAGQRAAGPGPSGSRAPSAGVPSAPGVGGAGVGGAGAGAAGAGSGDGWSAVSRSDAPRPPIARPDGAPARQDLPTDRYATGPAGGYGNPGYGNPGYGNPGYGNPGYDGSGSGGSQQPDAGGLGSRISSAASTVAATATAAAVNAKTAMKTAANEAESRAGRPVAGRPRGRQPRRARLTLSHINVYSVFKFSCVLAIALFFVWLITVGVLYGILDVSGVFDRVNSAVHDINGNGKDNNVITGSVVFGFAIIIGVVNIVLFIALSTVGAMVYNLCADLVGGAEVTLSERE